MNGPSPLQRLLESTGTAAETQESFSDPDSLTGRVEAVHRAFSAAFPNSDDGPYNYVEEVYETELLARIDKNVFRIPYTYDASADDPVVFGDRQKVKVSLAVQNVEESTDEPERIQSVAAGHILESLDDGEGWVWRVTMVRPGISRNNRRYTPEVLTEAVSLYEGARSFDGHRDQAARRQSSLTGLMGWHENVTVETDGRLTSDYHISESRDDIRQLFLTAWRKQRPDLIGFSHDVSALTESVVVGGRRITDVRKIVEVHSVDVVADPSAGGRIERLVASRQEEDTMNLEQFLRAFRAGELTADQLAEAYEEHPEWQHIAEALEAEREAVTARITETPDDDDEPTRLSGAVRDLVIRHASEGMPTGAREHLTEALDGVHTEEEILRVVETTRSIWDAALAATPSQLPGQTNVQVGEEDAEKRQHALDAMIFGEREREGVPAFRSIKEAYTAYTGRNPYAMGDEDYHRWILAESVGAVPYPNAQRLTESIETGTWAEAFGDSIRRRLVAEYRLEEYNTWREITSDIGNLADFRTNRRVRVGGYDVLPTVGQGATYQPLTSPEDEEATYAPTKKGGTEDWTLEAVANDDLTTLRRIPRKLGRAAGLTLYRAIWNTTIAANATIYDSVALFNDASHSNDNAATALSEAGVATLRRRMIRQKQQGETSGFVGLMPRFLVVPPELFVTAFKLAQSEQAVVGAAESATTPNPFRGLRVIEVPTFTDADDWFLIADPGSVPTIEVGFYQGRQDPELFVQDQPTVGSVFTADKFTWKIRHIWGLTVLDFRGFQRGQA